jgi:hypothetical protein
MLYLLSQERPRTTRFEGDLMTLNAIVLWCPFRITSNGIVSCITSPNTRCLPSITSTRIGFFFVMSSNLWQFTKSLLMKYVEAIESNLGEATLL